MRITQQEKQTMIKLKNKIFGEEASVLLYGSRTDDEARGGDIDLMIIPAESDTSGLFSKKIKYLVKLKDSIGDQKIDLLLKKPNDSRGIVKTAMQEGVKLG